MKKTTPSAISLFIAILLLLTTIVSSCVPKDDLSNDNDSSHSEDPSVGSDTSDLNNGGIKPENETCVSMGKLYTPNVPASESYPDTYGKELTDGIYAPSAISYSDPKFCAWNVDNLSIVIDLEEVHEKLYKFEVSYLSINNSGIAPLSGGAVAYSVDDKEYTSIGALIKPEYEEGTVQKAVLETNEYIKARYIKFTLRRGSAWLFLDELSVYADIPNDNKNVAFLSDMINAYESDDKTNEDKISALNAISNKLVDRTSYKINTSKDKSYTLSRPSTDGEHKDSGKKLTDGVNIGALYESGHWVEFSGNEPLDIVIDLGKSYDDLSDFELSFFNNSNVSISYPDFVTFSVSENNEDFVEVGRVYGPSVRDYYTFNYALRLAYGVKGRYIKFAISSSGYDKYFIEEAAVFRYSKEADLKDALYPEISLPKISKEEFWSSSEPNYSKNQNLILGMKPQISSAVPLPASASNNNSLITDPKLTDGKYSNSTDIHSGMFFKFNQGAHREVIFDLEKTSTITSFAASFVTRKDWAVHSPPVIKYFLSDDGVNWYLVGQSTNERLETPEIQKSTFTLEKSVKARFVRFSFAVSTWAGCDELEVYGTKQVLSSARALNSLGVTPLSFLGDQFLKPSNDVLGGARDIMLSYHCNYNAEKKNPNAGYMSVEQYMPYVAYLDRDGKITDVMFDGYLFLASNSAFPSGGLPHKNSIKSDWIYVLDNLFKEDYNMDALNQATQKVKDELKLDKDYKYKVYATLYYPSKGVEFGDITGDGKMTVFDDNKARIAAIEWFVEEFYSRFNDGNYDNLEFAGFYWHHESMEDNDDEIEFMNGVADYIHSKGTQFFWIPYYLANGYSRYAEYGFDFACMQPNYAFNESAPLINIQNAAEIAKAYNMCIEMEIDPKALYNELFYKRWMDYLKGGVYHGYMEALHMYYQGGMPGAFYDAALSDDARIRLIYEYTYQFMNHKLKLQPDKLDDVSFKASMDKHFEGTINVNRDINYTEYRLSVSAQNGTVTINKDGSFIYYPNKGFTGTDTFMYQYSEQLDFSQDCVVKITVSE